MNDRETDHGRKAVDQETLNQSDLPRPIVADTSPMRITFLSPPPNLSGGERVVAIYAQKLADRGHRVEVVCVRPNKIAVRHKLRRLLAGQGWPRPLVIGESHYENYRINYRVIDHAGPLTDQDIPDGDVVIASFWTTAVWANSLSTAKGRPIYLVQHDEKQIQAHTPDSDRSYELDMPQICVSQWIADEIRKRHPGVRQTVIPNSVDTDFFRPTGDSQRPRPLRVGMLWSTLTWRGCDIAVSAIERARDKIPELEVITIGHRRGDHLPNYFTQHLSPTQEELVELYGSCRAWLFSSRIEGFGLPILEAMACGTPVIGTPAGAAPDLVPEGGGVLVPHENPRAMAEAIVDLCQTPLPRWRERSTSALAKARSYSWDDAAEKLEQSIVALTRRPQGSARLKKGLPNPS